MSAPGFMVWSPEGEMPTYVHPTFVAALAEAERLKRLCRHRRFYVMSPVDGLVDAVSATAFDQGRAEGLAEARREIMAAEAAADRAMDEIDRLKVELKSPNAAQKIAASAEAFQGVVADCVTWFAGFSAANHREETQPWTPDRGCLRRLNGALQELARQHPQSSLDDEIPF